MNDIRLIDYRAESLQFDMNHHFRPNKEERLPLSIKLDTRIVRMGSTAKEPCLLNLRITVFDNSETNNYPFEIIADLTGVFQIDAEGSDRIALIKDEGLKMLIPYARSSISQLVSLANIPTPVILPPIDPAQMQQEKTPE